RLEPDAEYPYADLSGPGGEFGTLDYGDEPPAVYLGREVTLDDLGVPESVKAAHRERRQVEGLHLNCPQCGGALELRAPDKTERPPRPNGGGLLDENKGQLQSQKARDPPKVKPVLPLGAAGKVAEGEMTVIGFLQRSVKIEGSRYFWEE